MNEENEDEFCKRCKFYRSSELIYPYENTSYCDYYLEEIKKIPECSNFSEILRIPIPVMFKACRICSFSKISKNAYCYAKKDYITNLMKKKDTCQFYNLKIKILGDFVA